MQHNALDYDNIFYEILLLFYDFFKNIFSGIFRTLIPL